MIDYLITQRSISFFLSGIFAMSHGLSKHMISIITFLHRLNFFNL